MIWSVAIRPLRFKVRVGYGDIIRIADGARFHLRSAHQILSALFPDLPAFLEALDELLRELEFGLPKGALKLIDLPVALSRGQYLGLFAAGAGTVDAVYALDQDTLVRCVGSNVAKLLREAEAISRAAR